MPVQPPDNRRLEMQRAVLQPFPPISSNPPSSLSELDRLDQIIQNAEQHNRQVKDAILAASLRTLPSPSPSTPSRIVDPRLARRDIPQSKNHGQDALLASLRVPHDPNGKKSLSGAESLGKPASDTPADPFFSRVAEVVERLDEYDRGHEVAIASLKAERKKLAAENGLPGSGVSSDVAMKVVGYDRSRDPRLKTGGTDEAGAKATVHEVSRDPRLRR